MFATASVVVCVGSPIVLARRSEYQTRSWEACCVLLAMRNPIGEPQQFLPQLWHARGICIRRARWHRPDGRNGADCGNEPASGIWRHGPSADSGPAGREGLCAMRWSGQGASQQHASWTRLHLLHDLSGLLGVGCESRNGLPVPEMQRRGQVSRQPDAAQRELHLLH